MDGIQLRDEAVRDRVRLATEFLDPGRCFWPKLIFQSDVEQTIQIEGEEET